MGRNVPGERRRRFPASILVLSMVLAVVGHGAALAGYGESPVKRVSALRAQLRSRSQEERRAAVAGLVALDSALSVAPLEDAVRQSISGLDKEAKPYDVLDGEFLDAFFEYEDVQKYYPSLVADYRTKFLEAGRRLEAKVAELRGMLDVILDAGTGLGSFRNPAAVDRVAAGARNERHPLIRQMYLEGLGAIGDPGRVPVLLEVLGNFDSRVRALGARALGRYPPRPEILEALATAAATDKSWAVRWAACEGVARGPLDRAVPVLVEAVAREEGEVALRVDSLLRSLVGVTFEGNAKAWAGWWEEHGREVTGGTWVPPEDPRRTGTVKETATSFFRIPVESRNLLLVLDYSSSMEEEMVLADSRADAVRRELDLPETRLGFARAEAIHAIRGLPDGARFNVLIYHDKASRFADRAQVVSSASRRRAEKWLLAQKTGYLTNIWGGLLSAFGDPFGPGGNSRFDDLPDTLVFLTDGEPTNGRFRDAPSLGNLVGLWNSAGRATLHTVGLGEGHDAELLALLARSTGGFYVDMQKGNMVIPGTRPSVPPEERTPTASGIVERLRTGLAAESPAVRMEALARAHRLPQWEPALLPLLLGALEDEDDTVVTEAANLLVGGGPGAVPFILEAVDSGLDSPTYAVLDALEARPTAAMGLVPPLATILLDPGAGGKVAAARALGALGPVAAGAVEALESAATAAEAPLAEAAKEALGRIRRE